jgi:hypothetical protein
MKNISLTILIFTVLVNSALASSEKSTSSVEINYSLSDVFGTQFEFDISKAAKNRPVSMQLFWKSYAQNLGTINGISNTWNTTAVGVAGVYNLTSIVKFDKKLHPYAGVGLMSVSHTWTSVGPTPNYSGVGGGLYVTSGVLYELAPQLDIDMNYNNFGDITVGASFSF